MWYLDTYAKDTRAFCGHYFELEDLFPEVAEEESRNRELDPLRNFVPVEKLEKSYRDPHMVEFDNSPPIFSSQEEDTEYVKAYDRWIESNAPKADFDLSLGDCDPIVEELEIHTAQQAQQMSANLESMSPEKQQDLDYDAIKYLRSDYPRSRNQRKYGTRGVFHGPINPPRQRKLLYEKRMRQFAENAFLEEVSQLRKIDLDIVF